MKFDCSGSNCDLSKVMLQVVMMPSSVRLAKLRLSLVEVHHGPGGVSGHGFGTPPHGPAGQRQCRGLAQYD
jgi:hypothetical protein